jgi:protein ImuB
VTAAAGRLRVRAGMTVAEARARCAALEVLAWSEPAVEQEVVRTTAAFLVASPQVTPVGGAPGLWWIGAGGLDGIGGERGLVRTLLRVARLWHPRARVAVADSCVAARAATWADHDGAPAFVVPRGACAAYLAPAPLALIPMEDELRQTLHALGLRTAGALAALEAPDVERRWGATGLQAWRLARGEDRRRPVLARADAERVVSAELATSVATMEPILFLVRAALDRLVAGLVAEGRAAAAVAITLTLDDGRGALPAGGVAHTVTREIRLPRPLARVAPLFERCRALLDRWTLQAPVCGVAVAVVATAPAPAEQGELLAAGWRDPAAADAALARLCAELGPDVVVRPVARDAHAPERRGAWEAVGEEEGGGEEGGVRRLACGGVGGMGGGGRGAEGGVGTAGARGAPPEPQDRLAGADDRHRPVAPRIVAARPTVVPDGGAADGDGLPPDLPAAALRLLETPEAVDVEWRDGAPRAVRWRGRCVPVAQAAGPERLAGDWWTAPYRRDYWRCAADEGEFLIYRDYLDPADAGARWYLQGWYD